MALKDIIESITDFRAEHKDMRIKKGQILVDEQGRRLVECTWQETNSPRPAVLIRKHGFLDGGEYTAFYLWYDEYAPIMRRPYRRGGKQALKSR